jgi:hypothetical protein
VVSLSAEGAGLFVKPDLARRQIDGETPKPPAAGAGAFWLHGVTQTGRAGGQVLYCGAALGGDAGELGAGNNSASTASRFFR